MVGYTSMALDTLNICNVEQPALKGLMPLNAVAGIGLAYCSSLQSSCLKYVLKFLLCVLNVD